MSRNHIISHLIPNRFAKNHKRLPDDVFYFIYNMQLSSLDTAVVATFVIKTNQPPMDLSNSKLIKDLMNDIPSSDDDDDDDEQLTSKMSAMSASSDVANGSQHNHPNQEQKTEEMNSSAKPDPSNKKNKKIVFTQEDIESIPNIEQKVQHDDVYSGLDSDNLWCPKLGYRAYDEMIWKRFLKGDELFINQRLKIIPRIVEGSWYFTFPQRPALLGMKTPQRCYRGENYLEVDVEADNNYIAAQITKAAYHISTYLVVDIMLTLEGQKRGELPERCLAGFTLRYPDTTKAVKLNAVNEDDEEYYQQSLEHNHQTL